MIPGMFLQAVDGGDVVAWDPSLAIFRLGFTPFPIVIITQDPELFTFSDAESVISTGHKIIECHKKVGVIFTGPSKKVFLGVPSSCFAETLGLKVRCHWPLQGFVFHKDIAVWAPMPR